MACSIPLLLLSLGLFVTNVWAYNPADAELKWIPTTSEKWVELRGIAVVAGTRPDGEYHRIVSFVCQWVNGSDTYPGLLESDTCTVSLDLPGGPKEFRTFELLTNPNGVELKWRAFSKRKSELNPLGKDKAFFIGRTKLTSEGFNIGNWSWEIRNYVHDPSGIALVSVRIVQLLMLGIPDPEPRVPTGLVWVNVTSTNWTSLDYPVLATQENDDSLRFICRVLNVYNDVARKPLGTVPGWFSSKTGTCSVFLYLYQNYATWFPLAPQIANYSTFEMLTNPGQVKLEWRKAKVHEYNQDYQVYPKDGDDKPTWHGAVFGGGHPRYDSEFYIGRSNPTVNQSRTFVGKVAQFNPKNIHGQSYHYWEQSSNTNYAQLVHMDEILYNVQSEPYLPEEVVEDRRLKKEREEKHKKVMADMEKYLFMRRNNISIDLYTLFVD